MTMQRLDKELPSLPPSEIKGTSDNYKGMIMTQINRILYLITLGNAKYEGKEQLFTTETLAKSAIRGLRALEAILTPILPDQYETNTREAKNQITQLIKRITDNELEFYDHYCDWLTELIKALDKLNMIPEEEIELEFD